MLRAVALAVAVVSAFLGVMYLRFQGDTVPVSAPTPLPSPRRISISERCKSYARVPKPPQCGAAVGWAGQPTVPPPLQTPTTAPPSPEVRERLTVLRSGSNVGLASVLGRIVFVRGSDIWVRDLASDEEYQLTNDERNTAPHWSADGRWIAFQKSPLDPSIGYGFPEWWVMSADGQSTTKLADEALSVAWSPVHALLAYTGGGFINTYNPDTAERRVLARAGHFGWSPDGLRIGFDWSEAAGGDQVRQGLSIISADGSGARRDVYQAMHQSSYGPIPQFHGWSGDGRYLSFWQEQILSASISADGAPLFVIPADGGKPQEVGRTLLYQNGIIAWAPNSSQIAFVNGGGRDIWVRKHVVISDLAGAGAAFRNDDGTAELNPAWSPQSDVVAFSRGEGRAPEDTHEGPGPAATRRIWLGDSAGGVQQLTSDDAYSDNGPLWSNDGSRILFVRLKATDIQGYGIRAGAGLELWLMNGDGSEQRKVLEFAPATLRGYYGFIYWNQLFDWYRGR